MYEWPPDPKGLLYDPVLWETSKKDPRKVHLHAVHTIIHPDPLAVGAIPLSYDPSVTARNVPLASVS
jgi:hypothetical protein